MANLERNILVEGIPAEIYGDGDNFVTELEGLDELGEEVINNSQMSRRRFVQGVVVYTMVPKYDPCVSPDAQDGCPNEDGIY